MTSATITTWVEHRGQAWTIGSLALEAGVSPRTVLSRYREGWRGYWLGVRRLDSRFIAVSPAQVGWLRNPNDAPVIACAYAGKCNSLKCPLHQLPPSGRDKAAWIREANQ